MHVHGKHEQDATQIGVDFGVGMTVVAVSDPVGGCYTMEIPGISRSILTEPINTPVHGCPSLIQYEHGRAVWFGEGVARAGVGEFPTTVRWMRRYLMDRSPVQIATGNDRHIRYEDAATEYLGEILTHALQQHPGAGLVFSVPHDAPAEYRELLVQIARSAGFPSCSWVHEFQAAAAGYGCQTVAGEPFLVIAFSEEGSELTVIVPDKQPAEAPDGGMRVIVHVTGSTGTHAIDTWIADDLRVKFRLLESDPRAVRLAPDILYEAGRIREQIPCTGELSISLTDSRSGKTFFTKYTPEDFENVLTTHGIILNLDDCIGRALSGLQMRGVDSSRIRNVLLLGAGCAIPKVRETIGARFPSATIHSAHPLDAIARGTALYHAPIKTRDWISRSYALRYWDAGMQEHHYRFLVHSGTRYPSAGQVARVAISAAYDGQTHLGIPIYEIGNDTDGSAPGIELVSSEGGGVRIASPQQNIDAKRTIVHANERTPTLLVATPPARKSEPRFECTFTIDTDRNLCISARDLVTGMLVKQNAPVIRLT
jgi:molecular chaperone DnaK (HSP70)